MVSRSTRSLPRKRDVIAAERALGDRAPVVAGRSHANGYARQPGDRLDDANELRRAKHSVVVAEARRKVGDADRGIFSCWSEWWKRPRYCARTPTKSPPCRRARRRRIPSPHRRPAGGRKSDRRRSADKHHHTNRDAGSSSAAVRPLPITARSNPKSLLAPELSISMSNRSTQPTRNEGHCSFGFHESCQ